MQDLTFVPGLPNAPMNMQSSHQPGIGMKPGTQTPPANVLQVVKQVQEEAARQQAPHVGYGKGCPGPVMSSLTMPPPPSIRGMPSHIGANQGKNFIQSLMLYLCFFCRPVYITQDAILVINPKYYDLYL